MTSSVMVTGATGNVGRELVKLLLEAGVRVTGVTRRPDAAGLPEGARVVPTDALGGALDDVEALFVVPRAAGPAVADLLSLAARRGVRRVVVVSATTVQERAGEERFARAFEAGEEAARACGMPWTILRCADFAVNAMVWAPQIRAGDVVRGAHGDAATSPVHERDVAAVAARALVEPGHAGRIHVLTGAHSLDQRERVRLIGSAIGRDLRWEETPPGEVRAAMLAAGLPEEAPDRLLGYLADHVGRPGTTTADVERILGRPALTFAGWASEHAAAFRT